MACLIVFIHVYTFSQPLDLNSLSTYYVPICIPDGFWAFAMNTFQFIGWFIVRDQFWETVFEDVIRESCRGYGAGEKPWALEQWKDPK